jgi:hypothetical protein
MNHDSAKYIALRILEQAIEDATCEKIFEREYNNRLKILNQKDALKFFGTEWFTIVSELAGFDSYAVASHIRKSNHKQTRKTI